MMDPIPFINIQILNLQNELNLSNLKAFYHFEVSYLSSLRTFHHFEVSLDDKEYLQNTMD